MTNEKFFFWVQFLTLRSISQPRLRCVCRKENFSFSFFFFLFPVAFSHDFDLITAIAFVRLGGMLHVDFHTLSAGLARFESVERGGSKEVSRW